MRRSGASAAARAPCQVRVRIGGEKAQEHLGDDARADAGKVRPAGELRLLEDVVPERRAAFEADAERG